MFKLFIIITILLLSGCGGSAGSAGLSGSSFASGSGSAAGGSAVGSSLAVVSNPEPSSMILFGVGLAGLAAAMIRKRK